MILPVNYGFSKIIDFPKKYNYSCSQQSEVPVKNAVKEVPAKNILSYYTNIAK